MQKQISLTIPEPLFEASQEYYQELGYRSLQEFILDIVRQKVILENIERYREIEDRIKRSVGAKKFNQKGAVEYLRGL
ncbi:MAG: hypothetical protein HY363_03165 [Candidatus Aenigmarchaeota archaeon]|nr:hypothetical protein [Candidatus Aenigmarchaeota archaeon]